MSSITKETRKASIRASIASGDGGGIDLANCDTATKEILKDFDFDKNGYISKEEITLGATLYQKSLKVNEQFKKMILCLILGYFVFCLTLGGLIYGIVKANEQVRVDPVTGITTTTGGGDAVIMKTAPALVVRKDTSVHNVTIADLNVLEKIVFFDGTISFNVMGFARKEDETVILVQGGSLTFDMDGLFNYTGVEPALLSDHVSGGDRKLESITSGDIYLGIPNPGTGTYNANRPALKGQSLTCPSKEAMPQEFSNCCQYVADDKFETSCMYPASGTQCDCFGQNNDAGMSYCATFGWNCRTVMSSF